MEAVRLVICTIFTFSNGIVLSKYICIASLVPSVDALAAVPNINYALCLHYNSISILYTRST